MTLCNIFIESSNSDSTDEPLTCRLARFVRELIRIRKKYVDLLFYKHSNGQYGATIQGASIRDSAFKPFQPNDRSRASVVNFGDTPEPAEVDIVRGEITITTPFLLEYQAVLPVRIALYSHHFAGIAQP